MKKTLIGFLCCVILTSLAGNNVFAADGLSNQINQILKTEPDLQGAITGISIRSAVDGREIFNQNGEIRLRPASNMKLLTAVAALNVLGENYAFSTEVYSDGPVKKNTLHGNLFLKGNGDPTLLKSDFDHLAAELRNKGIRKIKGNLIGDDTHFDDIRYSKDLPWSDETTYYGAQISALTASPTTDYDAGAVMVEVKPGEKEGDKVHYEVTPMTEYVKVVNGAVTSGKGSKKDMTIERIHAKNTIMITGSIPVSSKGQKEWVAVWNPTRYTLTLFKESLNEHGIKVTGKTEMDVVPDTATVLATHRSMPLSELLVPFMKLSNNTHAEVLIKEMGRLVKEEGSWEKGLEVLNTEMTKCGLNPKSMVIRDGSGVSHVTSIPASQISQLLFSVQKQSWFPAFFYSLPVAGAGEKWEGGSLRYRMKTADVQGRVFAKTGTLTTVSALSGYVKTNSGETLIFSILLNNLLDEEKGKKVEDKIIRVLAAQ